MASHDNSVVRVNHPDEDVAAILNAPMCRYAIDEVPLAVDKVYQRLTADNKASIVEKLLDKDAYGEGWDAYEMFAPPLRDFHVSLWRNLYMGTIKNEKNYALVSRHLQRDVNGVTILAHLCHRLLAERGHHYRMVERNYNVKRYPANYQYVTPHRILIAVKASEVSTTTPTTTTPPTPTTTTTPPPPPPPPATTSKTTPLTPLTASMLFR